MFKHRFIALAFSLGLALWSGCGKKPGTEGAAPGMKPKVIAMIPKGATHIFWKTVERGAVRAAQELNVDLRWKGPLKENDRVMQIQVVQQFVADKVDGILLAPLDSRALLGPVREARAAGIPVAIFDSDLEGEAGKDFQSFIATDNTQGGRLAGAELARLLGGKGSVVLLRYMAGSASTAKREAGFEEALAKAAGIQLTVKNRYAGATAGEAQIAALNLMDKVKEAQGVFCSNESATNGMLQALRKQGLAGKIKFVGFDASPPLIEALRKGEIDALVVQNPDRMGYLAVKTMMELLSGGKPALKVDTGVTLITPANLDTPAIQALLK
jgi:ribose transport system substrate-binding protein